ncbi:MAG: endonuclease/exonuclease/phosphatase family protein [Myxococcota bacterium]
MSWNVHGFVGFDRIRSLERVADVLRGFDADVVALQEVDAGREDEDAFEVLGPELGLAAVEGPTLRRGGARYGNLLLVRHPLLGVERIDLSQPGAEPRGAIDARLEIGRLGVRVVATHLGLRRRERALQARRLCDALGAPADGDELVVLLGDLNEWRRPLRATGLAPLAGRFAKRTRLRTFPSRAPLFALDRVMVDRAEVALRTHAVDTRRARTASDHLPVYATIAL